MKRIVSIHLIILSCLVFFGGCASAPTEYKSTTTHLSLPVAPAGYKKIKVALINFRDLSNNNAYLVEPATSQLTTLLIRSGYFDVIEPSLVENIIKKHSDISTEKLTLLKEKFGAELFITGSLTNFEIKQKSAGFCLLFGLLGSYNKDQYVVDAGIDFRVVRVPDATIVNAGHVENQRTDTSKSAGFLFSYGGNDVKIKQSSGGKLLRHALRDVTVKIINKLPGR